MRQFITSMSAKGYETYGKTFLEKAAECLPGQLIVYTEDTVPKEAHGVIWRDLNQVAGFRWFLDGVERFPAMHGQLDGSGKRNYRYDIATFCRKCFAQIDAAANHQDEMWWIDADVSFTKPIPESFFEDSLKGVFMAYQGRPDWHSCASLVGFNNRHKQAPEFWALYMSLFTTGTVFLIGEWHDSYLLDRIREDTHLLSRDMAGKCNLGKGPVNVFDEVLGEYAHHKKGNLKYKATGPARYGQLIEIVKQLQPKRILEVGTWNGNRALEMHAVAPNAEYVGFDLFELATDETDAVEKNVKPHHNVNDVVALLTEAGIEHKLYNGDTKETLRQYRSWNGDESADFIFIDGGHSYETIKSDLDNALAIIKPGGTIVLDDWYEDMPEDDLENFGCNRPLNECGRDYEVLPIADPVKGGGVTKMVVMKC